MTRIIAGTAGGRRIATPSGDGTRPTSDRVREAIFSRLDHLGVLDGGAVLDLYAGSGALGLEAVSRGARSAVLVESHRGAAACARRNAADLGMRAVRVRPEPVERVVAARASEPADVVLIDPPYAVGEEALAGVLAGLADNGWLLDGSVVVVERSSRTPEPTWPATLEPMAHKTYGETVVWYAEHRPDAGPDAGSDADDTDVAADAEGQR